MSAMRMFGRAGLTAAVAGALTLAPIAPAPPASAASATSCVMDGTLTASPGYGYLPGSPGGGFFISGLALACAGGLLGTGTFAVAGAYMPTLGIVNFAGDIAMAVGGDDCEGDFFATSAPHGTAVTIVLPDCGVVLSAAAQLTPLAITPGPPPLVTAANFAALAGGATGGGCAWAASTGCAYIADAGSANALVVSPTQPGVTGASASWIGQPIPGTGTTLWRGSLSHAVGAAVTLSAPPNTSGAVVSA